MTNESSLYSYLHEFCAVERKPRFTFLRAFFLGLDQFTFAAYMLKYTKYPSKLKTAQASFRWVISNYEYMETAQFLIMERKHCQDIHKDGELCRLEDRQRDATEMY